LEGEWEWEGDWEGEWEGDWGRGVVVGVRALLYGSGSHTLTQALTHTHRDIRTWPSGRCGILRWPEPVFFCATTNFLFYSFCVDFFSPTFFSGFLHA